MKVAFLGVDTSCYTTSCAAADGQGSILISEKMALPVELGQRGLRQRDAVFAHIRQFPTVYQNVLQALKGYRLQAVCVSSTPTDDVQSYMPVFQAGLAFAKTIAQTDEIPLFLTTHQRGHFAAAMIGHEGIKLPPIGVHISGGTTDFLFLDRVNGFKRFSHTMDIHAGQLIDRVGVRMGYSFPAGTHLERLAQRMQPTGRYPAVVKREGSSLSGVEAQAMRDIEDGLLTKEQIAIEIYDVLSRLLLKTLDMHGVDAQDVLVTGGVASSQVLKSLLQERAARRRVTYRMLFSKPEFACDNAAGVALIGLQQWKKERDKTWQQY